MTLTKNDRIKLGIWFGVVCLCLWVVITKTQLESNLTQFMPAASTDSERVLLDQLQKGVSTRLLLIAVRADSSENTAKLSKLFRQSLEKSTLFKRVTNGQNQSSQDEVDLVLRYRYLLSSQITPEYFQADNLRAIFAGRLQQLMSPAGMLIGRNFTIDPTNETGFIQNTIASAQQNNIRHGVLFSQDANSALLIAETKAAGFDINAQEAILATIKQLFVNLDSSEQAELQISGPAVFAVESRDTIRSAITQLSILATVMLIAILIIAYRSFWYVIINALPIGTAILVAVTCVSLVYGGSVHGITLAFGITVLGVALDYSIHVFSHSYNTQHIESEVKKIWPTLRLGVLTTCACYLAFTMTSFSGLAQLAIFAIGGLLAAASFTRWILPVLLFEFSVPKSSTVLPRAFHRLLEPGRLIQLIAYSVAIAGLIYLATSNQKIWGDDLASINPVSSEKIQLDRKLRKELGAADVNHLLLVNGDSVETVLQRLEILEVKLKKLHSAGHISGYELVSRYLPSQNIQKTRLASLPTELQLRSAMRQALKNTAFREDSFETFINDVVNTKNMMPLQLEDLKDGIYGVKIESMLIKQQDGWLAMVPLYGTNDSKDIKNWLANEVIDSVEYLNLKEASSQMISDFRIEALGRIKWAALLVLGVLFFGLRSIHRVIITILPVILAILLDVATLMLMGKTLSLFHLIALMLVFGIGVDYSLFFGREDVGQDARRKMLHALLICVVSTVVVFGLLAISDIQILINIGQTVAIGVIYSFLFSMVISQRGKIQR